MEDNVENEEKEWNAVRRSNDVIMMMSYNKS